MPEKIRIAMLGGATGSMIGPVHRAAMRMTDKYVLVAGVFSSNIENSIKTAESLGIPKANVYKTHEELLKDAPKLKLDAVSITTPNYLHVEAAQAFVDHGIHVICEKPLGTSLDAVDNLLASINQRNAVFVLTHPYSAYPVIRKAQQVVAEGKLGQIKMVAVEYIQGWLAELLEKNPENKGAVWRENPKLGGAGGVLGDIGTHAFQLVEFVSGLKVESLLSQVTASPGREVADDAKLLLRLSGGATGSLWCSQVAVGARNGLSLRIFGEKGSLEWSHDRHEELHLFDSDNTETVYHKGQNNEGTLPSGHPEGYYEAFAVLYDEFADEILRRRAGDSTNNIATSGSSVVPDATTGVRGLRFIDATIESNKKGNVWVSLK